MKPANPKCIMCNGSGHTDACVRCVFEVPHDECFGTFHRDCDCTKSWKLFLDDDARKEGMEDFRYPPPGEDDWKIACSSTEAIDLIATFGVPSFISFDHDLGALPDGKEDTAMRVCNYLAYHHYDDNIEYQVHSRNPYGSKNIVAFMESWKKSKSLP